VCPGPRWNLQAAAGPTKHYGVQARRRDGEAAGKQTGVFQQPFLKKEVNLFFDVAWNNLKYDSPS
jgi:hypothetical protein